MAKGEMKKIMRERLIFTENVIIFVNSKHNHYADIMVMGREKFHDTRA